MKALLIALLSVFMVTLATTTVSAADTTVEQEQEQKIDCRVKISGSYGQEAKAECEAEQKQRQKVVIGGGKVLGKHTMADASLSGIELISIAGVALSGTGVAAVKLISRRIA